MKDGVSTTWFLTWVLELPGFSVRPQGQQQSCWVAPGRSASPFLLRSLEVRSLLTPQ